MAGERQLVLAGEPSGALDSASGETGMRLLRSGRLAADEARAARHLRPLG